MSPEGKTMIDDLISAEGCTAVIERLIAYYNRTARVFETVPNCPQYCNACIDLLERILDL